METEQTWIAQGIFTFIGLCLLLVGVHEWRLSKAKVKEKNSVVTPVACIFASLALWVFFQQISNSFNPTTKQGFLARGLSLTVYHTALFIALFIYGSAFIASQLLWLPKFRNSPISLIALTTVTLIPMGILWVSLNL